MTAATVIKGQILSSTCAELCWLKGAFVHTPNLWRRLAEHIRCQEGQQMAAEFHRAGCTHPPHDCVSTTAAETGTVPRLPCRVQANRVHSARADLAGAQDAVVNRGWSSCQNQAVQGEIAVTRHTSERHTNNSQFSS